MGKSKIISLKELCPPLVRENSFEGGPGGGSGALNYQTPYGTPQGGNATQNSSFFGASSSGIGKGPNHVGADPNEYTGSANGITGYPPSNRPDRQSSSGAPIHPGAETDKGDFEQSTPGDGGESPHMVSFDSKSSPLDGAKTDNSDVEHPNAPSTDLSEPSPGAKADQAQSNKPLNPDQTYDKDVDKMFTKKQTPSPDEIMSALQYELGKMVKKDKTIAKRMVLKNLQENPHYYSQLDMLGINDDKMKVDESQISRTKNVLDQMIAERKKAVLPPTPHLDEIFQELKDRRYGATKKAQSQIP